MKTRITLTIDPQIVRRAKRIAHVRRTSVSALVEEFVRAAPDEPGAAGSSFVQQWAGKFRVAASAKPDARLAALKARYHLDDQ
ncbi:MAG: hypothetical protein HZB53_16380 [Chloroflexi bacterium]|nr:hypothetical protein [Chloroflexota bacterium]